MGASPWGFESPLRHVWDGKTQGRKVVGERPVNFASLRLCVLDRLPALIPSHSRLHLRRPGVDPSRQASGLESRALQQLLRHEGPLSLVTDGDDFCARVELGDPGRQLAERNQSAPLNAGDLPFPGLAHVEHRRRARPGEPPGQVGDRDLTGMRLAAAHAAIRLVVHQAGDAGLISADRARGVSRHAELAEAHPERCTGIVLRGIFLSRKAEVLWTFGGGAQRVFPDGWAEFLSILDPSERGDVLAAYHRRLNSADPAVRRQAALALMEMVLGDPGRIEAAALGVQPGRPLRSARNKTRPGRNNPALARSWD